MSRKEEIITPERAKELLWEQGELSWKLKGVQKKIRDDILNDVNNVSVVVAGRRTGKSFTMCLIAVEYCLKRQNAIVKYACPKQKMVKTIIRPIMRTILEDCPKHLKPEWREADKVYIFPNGSEIHIAGTDNENADTLRGSAADLALCDEAGYMTDLTYVVRSVLSPILKTRNGKLILASTPSRSPNHAFITDFMDPYVAEGRCKIYTIYDNPNFSQAVVDEIIAEYPRGTEDPSFKLEYLCEVMRDADKSIIPSFIPEIERIIVTDQYTRPAFYDAYVGMDVGGSDLTAVVFGYYDYLNATLVIEDEVVMGKEVNTKKLAELIKEKEKELWVNPIDQSIMPPYMRVSDNNNLILLTDLQRDHGITFIPTRKDNREAAINSLDVAISQRKIIIHPQCKHLLYHIKFAEWNNSRTTFKKLKDSPTGQIKGGHADCLAALIYLHRNIIKSKNPYPTGYGEISGQGVFQSRLKKPDNDNSAKSWLKSLTWGKKKEK
jgi:hypothetical protein